MYFRFSLALLFWAGLGLINSSAAQTTGIDLAKSNNCLACHQVDSKRVGPAFTLVAERFVGQDGAGTYLANVIRSGGRGRWGAVPMPAQPQVSPADAQLIAAWILSLAKELPAVK